ncbi:hypothetical protein B0H16DRAFT_311394 [Mycena metata]|uniref:DUF6534 domain-containing protein n=1 Tax=Mycena metata TaxID=1033252 RepID=A0AAD7JMT1_9AGAR|nr:hypothetical protein B0H16DRAFT_311394 [Mycena metata]
MSGLADASSNCLDSAEKYASPQTRDLFLKNSCRWPRYPAINSESLKPLLCICCPLCVSITPLGCGSHRETKMEATQPACTCWLIGPTMTVNATIDNTYGLLFIAMVISVASYGVAILQFWLYIRKYHSTDPLALKLLVIAVLLCDTCQQALLCSGVYTYLVSAITKPALIFSLPRTVMVELFFSCAIATLVQQFYCWRIYQIGKNIYLAAAVSLIGWSACATLLVYSVKTLNFKFLDDLIELKMLAIASNSLSTVTDISISLVLMIQLHSIKTGSGFKKTMDMINSLMVFTFNNGLPTSACSVVATVSIVAFPRTFLYIFWFLLLGRFYTNSLFVTLNCRDYIQAASKRIGQEEYSLEASDLARTSRASHHDIIAIRMVTDTVSDFQPSQDAESQRGFKSQLTS